MLFVKYYTVIGKTFFQKGAIIIVVRREYNAVHNQAQ